MASDVAVEVCGKAVLVRVRKEWLDIEVSVSLRKLLTEAMAQHVGANFVLDLSQVTEMCSGALAVLVEAHREWTIEKRGRFLLAGARAGILKILEATHLTNLFEVFPTPTDALAHIEGAGEA